MLRSKGAPQRRCLRPAPYQYPCLEFRGVAHFYQELFGGDLLWVECILPNPFSPPAGSWSLLPSGTSAMTRAPGFRSETSALRSFRVRLVRLSSFTSTLPWAVLTVSTLLAT